MGDIKREASIATAVGGGGEAGVSNRPPVVAASSSSSSFYDPEIGRSAQEEFEEKIFTKEIRQGFIRYVPVEEGGRAQGDQRDN